jgi:hypothetical protein
LYSHTRFVGYLILEVQVAAYALAKGMGEELIVPGFIRVS